MGCDHGRRAQVSHRVQHQSPEHKRTGTPHCAQHSGAGTWRGRGWLTISKRNSYAEQEGNAGLNFLNWVQAGRLKGVQAIGWYIDEANLAQVSVNITDYEVTPIHSVFEEVVKDAKVIEILYKSRVTLRLRFTPAALKSTHVSCVLVVGVESGSLRLSNRGSRAARRHHGGSRLLHPERELILDGRGTKTSTGLTLFSSHFFS